MTRKKVSDQRRRRAERIIQATGAFPARLRREVQDALTNRPEELSHLFAEADRMERRAREFGRELHAFAAKAYFAALDFYAKNRDNPRALERFLAALGAGVSKRRL